MLKNKTMLKAFTTSRIQRAPIIASCLKNIWSAGKAFRSRISITLLAGAFVLPLLTLQGIAQEGDADIDHSPYDSLLKEHVTDKGLVNYKALMQDKSQLDKYLRQLRDASLEDASRATKLAFYVNAYNACTLQLILRHYPELDSIRDIGGMLGSPFKGPEWELAGEKLTLKEIEDEKLRKDIGDARIHFAINCASMSCPPLRDGAYTADGIDEQLEQMTRAFLQKNVRHKAEDALFGGKKYILSVSKIFKWYKDDYQPSVPGFIARYTEGDTEQFIREHQDEIKLDYQNYDWSLNAASN